jgi:fructoselysine 6-kinase
MAERLRVAAVGEVAEDLYLPEGESRLGGISANFARSAAACGAAAGLFGAVGDDARGRRLHAALRRAPLDPLCVRMLRGETARQRIHLGPGGERAFSGFVPGVLADYRLVPEEIDALRGFDVVAVPASPESRAVFEQVLALGLGRSRVADFSVESPLGDPDRPDAWVAPWLDRLDVAFVGGRPEHAGVLSALSASTGGRIVLTAGAAGAWAFHGEVGVHQPALPVAIVDTTGCGDAFQAAFTVSFFSGATLAQALAAGARRAARVAARRGGG